MRLFISIFLLTITSYLTAQSVGNQWETYKENVFSINYPTTNWVKTNELSARFCIATKETETKAYDRDKGFRDNLYLAENTFKESVPELGNYAQRATEQLKISLKNAQIIQSNRKKSATFAYQEVISEGNLGTHAVKMKQWHFVKGKKAYSLTFVARTEKFEESMGVVDELLSSFRLK